MNLLQRILECGEEELDSIIETAINEANKNAQPIEKLGFTEYGKSNSLFKGFIPFKTRIKYCSASIEDYGMETTDFFYEFAKFIRKYNIKSKAALIYNLEFFINSYFGYPGKMDRETIFNEHAWNTTTTDDEYFEALRNNKLGDLRGKGAAQCTERGALAQQILSLFEVESYYCMGCVSYGDTEEAHCFNIVKTKEGYALVDYSVTITSYDQDGNVLAYYPFTAPISNEAFIDFVNNGTTLFFDEYCVKGSQKVKTGIQRSYVVGRYEIRSEEGVRG